MEGECQEWRVPCGNLASEFMSPCPLPTVGPHEAEMLGTGGDALKGPELGVLPFLSQYNWENMRLSPHHCPSLWYTGFRIWQLES